MNVIAADHQCRLPDVAESREQRWTLIGGLMVQLHAVHHRIGTIRPTKRCHLYPPMSDSVRRGPFTGSGSRDGVCVNVCWGEVL
jgi:hypothetical protein